MDGFGNGKTKNLHLDLQVTDTTFLDDGFLILYSGETSRYFNAEDYAEQGYQSYSTIT